MDKKMIFVDGDFVLDHHIYEGSRHHYGDKRNNGVHVVEELGGAALVHYLLSEFKNDLDSCMRIALRNDNCRYPDTNHSVPPHLSSYAVWKPFECKRNNSSEGQVWRTEDAMGFGEPLDDKSNFTWPVSNPEKQPEIIILSDGNMGFRSNDTCWPDDECLEKAKWIVLKMSYPLAAGKLWDKLKQYRSKLIVIVSSNDLRKHPVKIESDFSWDSLTESVLRGLQLNTEMGQLMTCRHLLIAFGTEGCLWIEPKEKFKQSLIHLIYDAQKTEGEHVNPGKGRAFGALSCIAAAIGRQLALNSGDPDLAEAIEGGLSAIYNLHLKGHGVAPAQASGYPAKRLAEIIKKATCRYSRTSFIAGSVLNGLECKEEDSPREKCWSIVHEALRKQDSHCPEPAWDLAERVAIFGPSALYSLPHLSVGKLLSIDRNEIEALRSLKKIIIRYKNRPIKLCKKPLAIGVFGPPGSGKSFAVRQIANTYIGPDQWLEFNLSQFKEGTEDLIGAFHQIRDRVLKGQTPVVFFDEFDSRQYAWLQYLLAPMQDGAFQEGQITHPIGKCIFIFAGGTSETYETFGPPEKNESDYKEFQMAKGPDFKSRLDGFFNVMPPNRRDLWTISEDGQSYDKNPDNCDIFFPVRRAFAIRTQLGCKLTEKLDIDRNMLHALLRAEEYIHGARSLSKVLDSLKEAYPGPLNLSLLPSLDHLKLHIRDADKFISYSCSSGQQSLSAFKMDETTRDLIAATMQENYRSLGKKEGWLEEGSEKDVPLEELSDFLKESNRAAASRILPNLEEIGLTLGKGTNSKKKNESIKARMEYNLELLAQLEHHGWMEWHLDRGWQYGPKRDDNNKVHHCLKPYLHLSDDERNKDRNSIRKYSSLITQVGLRIMPAIKNIFQCRASPATQLEHPTSGIACGYAGTSRTSNVEHRIPQSGKR